MGPEADEQTTDEVTIEQGEATEAEAETEEPTTAEAETTSEPEGDGASDEPGEDDEVVVTIGDSPTPEEQEEQQAPAWVKELRKSHRETQRENRELRKKLEAASQPDQTQVKVGAKPKLEDFDYDTEQFEAALNTWFDAKRQADQQAADAEAQAEEERRAWQRQLDVYGEKKTALSKRVKGYDDAEANVLGLLSETQQGIIVQGSEDPALVIYAIGNNDGKLKDLAKITDPVKFSFAVAKLETQLKVKGRKAPPPPETTVSTGTAAKSGAVDSELERLRDEAARTGDYSKVHAYKRQKRRSAT